MSSPAAFMSLTSHPTPAGDQTERTGLGMVMSFGIVQLVGLIGGWVGSFFFIGTAFAGFSMLTPGQTPAPAQVNSMVASLFRDIAILIPLLAAIQVVGLILLYLGFRELNRVDPRFSTPSILTLLMLLGSLLVIGAAVPLFLALPSMASQLPTTTGSTVSPGLATAIGSLLVYFALMGIGGIVAFVGFIGGEMLGLWRVGSRYNETLLRLGAIFTLVPLLNFVAPILVIVGAGQARGRLQAQL